MSGGNAGYAIHDKVNHNETKIGETYAVVQFNLSGSFPSPAKIVGKHTFDWDMSKPIGQRKSNEKIEGQML